MPEDNFGEFASIISLLLDLHSSQADKMRKVNFLLEQ